MNAIPLRGGYATEDPRLDRLPEFDERSRMYPVAAVVPPEIKRGRTWWIRSWYDQGQEGACVSFAWHHEASASPIPLRPFHFDTVRNRYFEMQRIDEWEGGAYPGATPRYDGTSVLAGAKIMKTLGFFAEYRWAFTVEEVMRAIVFEGPVVFGIPWLDSMFNTQPSGLLDCSGTQAGGHAILGRGVILEPKLRGEANKEPLVRLHNSWGKDWGVNGDAFIKISDLEKLLGQQGECCVAIGRGRGQMT